MGAASALLSIIIALIVIIVIIALLVFAFKLIVLGTGFGIIVGLIILIAVVWWLSRRR